MSELTPDEVMVLERIVTKPELQPYFFGKVKSLKWFSPFKEKGLLAPLLNPKPVSTQDGYWSVPSWPITEYLVASSIKIKENNDLEAAGKYLALLKEVTQYAIDNDYSNYRTWWQFSKVIRNLPLTTVSTEDLRCVRYWLEDSFDKHLVGREIGEWVVELASHTDDHLNALSLYLLDALFTIKSVEGRYSNNKPEAVLQLDSYQANEFVKKSAVTFGEQLGLPAVELFEKKFTEVLEINGNDKWSNIWRNAIEEHKQNSSNDDANHIVLKIFRDSLLGYYESHRTEESKTKLIDILNSDYETIKRIGIYVAGEHFEHLDEVTIGLILSASHFNDKFRHELWHFLNKNFAQLSKAQQTSIIESISTLEVSDETGAILDKPTAYKQSSWYYAIIDVNELAKTNYQKCIVISGVEPDHPDFSCYTSVGAVVDVSPLSVTELAVMLETPADLVKLLNEYECVGHFNEPGIEGLVKTFGALVSLDDCIVLKNLEYFLDLKPHYLNELFSSYSKLWSEKKQRSWGILWPKLLDFSYTLFQKNSFWQSPDKDKSGPFIGDKHWVVSTYCRLVEMGCEKDERTFDLSLSEKVKNTLELILNRQSGSDFKKDSDAISVAINSPRGRCLEAYIKLALYQCKNVKKDSSEFQSIWATYESVFSDELNRPAAESEYEFIILVSMYIRNFFYLSSRWTNENLERIFGDVGSLQWLCAIQAYSYVGFVIPKIHNMFKSKNYYVSLLDESNLSDSIRERYIEYICISHIRKIENIDDEDSLLSLLLNRKNDEELSKIIWFFWSIRDQDIDVAKELVFDLWPKLVELIEQQTSEEKPLASKLSLWVAYIKELDEQSKLWLCAVAPFVNDDHNGMSFMKELARLSDTASVIDVVDVWKAILVKPLYMYDLAPVEQLFINLIAQEREGKDAAKEIADIYIRNGDENVVNLYRKIVDEKNA